MKDQPGDGQGGTDIAWRNCTTHDFGEPDVFAFGHCGAVCREACLL